MHKPPHRIYLIFFHPTDSRGQMPRTTSSFDEGADVVLESFMKPYHLKEGEVITRFICIKPKTG